MPVALSLKRFVHTPQSRSAQHRPDRLCPPQAVGIRHHHQHHHQASADKTQRPTILHAISKVASGSLAALHLYSPLAILLQPKAGLASNADDSSIFAAFLRRVNMHTLLVGASLLAVSLAHPRDPQFRLNPRQASCLTDPTWKLTKENWEAAKTDDWILKYWKSMAEGNPMRAIPLSSPSPTPSALANAVLGPSPRPASEGINSIGNGSSLAVAAPPPSGEVATSRFVKKSFQERQLWLRKRMADPYGSSVQPAAGGSNTPKIEPAPVNLESTSPILNASTTDNGFQMSLIREYIPGYDDSYHCSVISASCNVPKCSELSNEGQVEGGRQAWFAVKAMENFAEFFANYYAGIMEAQVNTNSMGPGFVKTFTEAGKPKDDHFLLRMLLNILQAVLAVALVFFPEMAVLAAAALPALAKVAGKAGPRVAASANKDALSLKLAVANAGTPGAITGGVAMKLLRSSDYTLDKMTTLGNWVTSISKAARDGLVSDLVALLAGKADASGAYIPSYLKEGAFVKPSVSQTRDVGNYLSQQFTAGSINALWRSDRTYIVMSDTDDCQNDKRGPQQLKFCRNNDTHVYYAYQIPDHGDPWPQVWAPYGYDHMSDYSSLSLQIAMESSVSAYVANKFSYEDVRFQRWANALQGPPENSPQNLKARMEGIFTLPVCYDPTGKQITTINKNKGRRYPCYCGVDGKETGLFAEASGLVNLDKWKDWCYAGNVNEVGNNNVDKRDGSGSGIDTGDNDFSPKNRPPDFDYAREYNFQIPDGAEDGDD